MDLQRIDCHSHVSFPVFAADREEVIRRAVNGGTGMLAVGTRKTSSQQAVTCADEHDGIWAIIGLHPGHTEPHPHHDIGEATTDEGAEYPFDAAFYRALAASSKKVVGIGECGLDYYRLPDDAAAAADIKARQRTAFRAQLDLAHELQLPVMIHCRDAHDDLASTLEEYRGAGKPLRGNIHCFTGTRAEAERYLAIGFYLSFTGVVTFPPRKADIAAGIPSLADVADAIPTDRLLIETDAPWLAPVPHRGERNEPAYVSDTAAFLAVRRGMTAEDFERATLQNARTLFGI